MSNTLLQPAAFLVMLYGGAVTGLLYDAFRLPRRLFRRRLIHTLADLLFAMLATLVAAGTLLAATGGAVRLYLVAGLLAGFFLEQWSLSYLVRHLFYSARERLCNR